MGRFASADVRRFGFSFLEEWVVDPEEGLKGHGEVGEAERRQLICMLLLRLLKGKLNDDRIIRQTRFLSIFTAANSAHFRSKFVLVQILLFVNLNVVKFMRDTQDVIIYARFAGHHNLCAILRTS